MNGGVKTALLISCATLAGCSTTEPVKVRAIADPSAALSHGDALAVARGQFMLGNIGLALEGFRKAQRVDPYNPAVMSGIGDCYAAMGRYDIAESSYEVALSLAPRDHRLLLGLASVLERGGDLKRARDIRDEAARFEQAAALMAAQAAARANTLAASQTPAMLRSAPTATVALPRTRGATVAIIAKPHPKADQPAVVPMKVAAATPIVAAAAPAAEIPKQVTAAAAVVATPAPAPAHRPVPTPVEASAKAAPPEAMPAVAVAAAASPAIVAKPIAPISTMPVVAEAARIAPVHIGSAAAAPGKPALLPVPPLAAASAAPAAMVVHAVAVVAAPPATPAPVEVKAAAPAPPVVKAATPAPIAAKAATPAPVAVEAAMPITRAAARDAEPAAPRVLPAVLPVEGRVASRVTSGQPLPPSPRSSSSSPPVEVAFRADEPGPRLQRLTNGEVALLTTKDASWSAHALTPTVSHQPPPAAEVPSHKEAALQTASAGNVNWVPLKMSRASASVQVLNAARSNGLAGSARNVLFGRGWRSVAIGNAGATRQTSVVFYPKTHARLGRRLAAQFGVRAKMAKTDAVVLLLGRDSIGRIANKRLS
jgi:hypothetical protein